METTKTTEIRGNESSNTEVVTTTRPKITAKPTFFATEQESGISLEIDLPGVSKADTRVTSEGNQIKVEASRLSETPEGWNLLNENLPATDYKLKLNLHHKLDLGETKATFQNGTLILEIPKKEEAMPKQIDILNG